MANQTSAEISEAIAGSGGTVFNINLPDWRSASPAQKQAVADATAEKKRRQLMIAGAVLVVVTVLVLVVSKRRSGNG